MLAFFKLLLNLLAKMGFGDSWHGWIKACISTVRFSVLVNSPTSLFNCSRGLRQGDPLSPYLFLFCVEGLNAILRSAATHGDIHGFSICRNGPKLTHLFFANNCVLFCRATLEECEKIQDILTCYERVSG